METVKSVQQSILVNDGAFSIDLTDAYLHNPIHPLCRKYLWFIYGHRLPNKILPIFPKSVDFHPTNGRNSSALVTMCHIPIFVPRRLADKRFDLQPTNISHNLLPSNGLSLGFIPNLKKSDLIPAQKFTFIGMEFLRQQNIVRVPADQVDSLILTIKTFLSQTQVSAQTFLSLLGKLSAAADFVLLGRLHLQPLQMYLLSVWRPHILSLDHQVLINSMIRFHLKWWMDTGRFVQGTPIHLPDPIAFIIWMPVISDGELI